MVGMSVLSRLQIETSSDNTSSKEASSWEKQVFWLIKLWPIKVTTHTKSMVFIPVTTIHHNRFLSTAARNKDLIKATRWASGTNSLSKQSSTCQELPENAFTLTFSNKSRARKLTRKKTWTQTSLVDQISKCLKRECQPKFHFLERRLDTVWISLSIVRVQRSSSPQQRLKMSRVKILTD